MDPTRLYLRWTQLDSALGEPYSTQPKVALTWPYMG